MLEISATNMNLKDLGTIAYKKNLSLFILNIPDIQHIGTYGTGEIAAIGMIKRYFK